MSAALQGGLIANGTEPWPVDALNNQAQVGWLGARSPKVYQAIAKVMAEIGKTGISKSRSNTQQGYKFRGIDDVYNALSGYLSTAGLCILPRVKSRIVTERVTQKGGVLFYVVLDMDFDIVCAEDGSKHTVAVSGEAMDSGDKATNKAMSAAFKYACMQVFCIPTEGNPDADLETHQDIEPAPSKVPQDVWTFLTDASRGGEKELRAAWSTVSEGTRKEIMASDKNRWETLKSAAVAHNPKVAS